MENGHIPVLREEFLFWLDPQKDGVYIDGTLGCGGHSEALLEKIFPSGLLIGIDRDQEALAIAQDRLSPFKGCCEFFWGNFSEMKTLLKPRGEGFADGIILDLGVSSLQLDKAERGFSFKQDAPLDMRMDREQNRSACDIVNEASQNDLESIFFRYGQEHFSRSIAKRIVREREKKPIQNTVDLANLVLRSYRKYSKIHPATRVFQALRISVNEELLHLELFLKESLFFLKKGGRLCVISYHSLEDRCVKSSFKTFVAEGLCVHLHKKPIIPQFDEIKKNRRARSAKMRVCQKI